VVGIPAPAISPGVAERFREAYGIKGSYLLCLGRIDSAKGSDLALRHFAAARPLLPDVTLVMMGPQHMPVPDAPGVVLTGLVPDELKHDAIAGALAVLLPSPYESLSIVALEAWRHGRPTIANADCAVLFGQTRRSCGGLWYGDSAGFAAAVRMLRDDPALGVTLGAVAQRWVTETTAPDRIRAAWLDALAAAAGRARAERSGGLTAGRA
jgi:glycosyltransferase involved in cell wall biosynthesis